MAIAIHVLRRAMAASGRVRYVTVMSVWLGPVLHMVPLGTSASETSR